MLCSYPYTELEKWRSAEFYEAEVHRMQLPISGKVAGMYASVEERQEKRVQQLRRLEEMSNRHREERLQQDQKRLHTLLTVQVNITYTPSPHIPHTHWTVQRSSCGVTMSRIPFLLSLCRNCWRRAQWSSFTGDWWSWTWTRLRSSSRTSTSSVWAWSSTD